MKAASFVSAKILIYFAGALALLLATAACPATDSPIPVGERATPTAGPTSDGSASGAAQPTAASGETVVSSSPTPAPTLEPTAAVATVQAREEEHMASLFAPTEGALKFAEWDDKPLQFSNALLGYILVYGYDFSVELVQVEQGVYQEAFQKGELDAVLLLDKEADSDWYGTHIDGKAITDLGSIRDGDGNLRLVAHSGLEERAPEVAEFLAKAKPTDALIDELSSKIRGGRIGIKPTTQAIKFLKEQESIWSQWAPPAAVDKVKAALEAGKTSLTNRKCIPDGGSGGGSPNCGT